MTSEPTLPPLVRDLAGMVETVIGEIRPRLVAAALSGERGENQNLRHADNFLSTHDLWMHERYRELLAGLLPSFVYASEEADPQVIGDDPDPDLCVLVDPLDTSELAVRALYGYTHLMVYSRSLARPVAAVVGDIFHHFRLYAAGRDDAGQDHAFLLTADGDTHRLRVTKSPPLEQALITNYSMRPTERFAVLAAQAELIRSLSEKSPDGKSRGRIGVDFGSIGLCHVAAGLTDAVVEFAKGFQLWDLAPGQYILRAAGGTVIDLQGQSIPLDAHFGTLSQITAAMKPRQKFIAAADDTLARRILQVLDV